MKKKIKDLTELEALYICHIHESCLYCRLKFFGGDYCIRKTYMDRLVRDHPSLKDPVDQYLNKEVELVKEEDLPSEDVAYFKKHCVR